MIWKIVKKEFLLIKGFNPNRDSIPDMRYQYTSLPEALEAGGIEILLLFLFNILFFVELS